MTEQRNDEPERVVVRDRRRIDPLTGEVRAPEGAQSSSEATKGAESAAPAEPVTDSVDDKVAELTAQLDERTADLQRVTAEYANYRRRVDRDREAVKQAARAQVVGELLAVLDDLDRAEAHGDLTGAFKAVADKLVNTLSSIGLESFGTEGDAFDPMVHEAVQHSTSPDVTGPTVTTVLRKGYRLGERLLRPAMVAVTDREPGAPDLPSDPNTAEAKSESAGEAGGAASDTSSDTSSGGTTTSGSSS